MKNINTGTHAMKKTLSILAAFAAATTLSQADLITPDSVIASSEANSGNAANSRDAGNLVSSEEMQLKSGGNAHNYADWEMVHSGDTFGNGDAWAGNLSVDQAQWVIMDLGAAYEVSTIIIWNMNPDDDDSQIGRSAKTVDTYYSLDRFAGSGDGNVEGSEALFSGTNWLTLATSTSVLRNPGNTTVTSPNAVLTDVGVTARYIALNFTDAHTSSKLDKVTVQEIQVFSAAVIPEPSTLSLLGVSAAMLVAARRRMHL